ncbi:MAG: HlyC/CorC family transporter [Bacteroidales bacterium]|nr:HlyC/CorC family transporter [Bacteroidales bacterium]MCB9012982.1 HlyC/CorC family transporter [Bacteroidales bacterium]
MMPQINLYLLVFLSLIFAIFFGGLGSSFLTTDRSQTEGTGRSGGFSSLIVSIFRSNPAVFVTSMLLGYFLSLVCFTLAFSSLSAEFFSFYLADPSGIISYFLRILSALLILLFTVFLLRLSIFRINPENVMRFFALPALFFHICFFPVSSILLVIINVLSRLLLRIKENIKKEGFFYKFTFPEFFSPFIISETVKENADKEFPEVKILQNALEFSKLKVRDCMVPRNEIEALEISSSIKELREKFIESGYSKILVYKDTIDNIVGYISSKELFKNPSNIESRLVKMSIVPESRQINKLLRNLIKERKSIALVVDEYGGTSGIITLEDIMEEIFGEIEDEHDIQEFVEKQLSENEFILSGRLEIDYLNEKYHLDIPETDDYDTLAGFIIFHHENIPELNDTIVVQDLNMKILKVSQTRIELVQITRIPLTEE